jgi:hypothetical protein
MGFRRLHHPLGAAALILTLSCGGASDAPVSDAPPHGGPSIHTHRQELRPTQGEGHLGNGYGASPVRSLASAGGQVRVWWAESGPDRPPVLDAAPADGVPDFVQEVADVADDVVARLEADGFRLPVRDTDRNDGDDGGDDRFDIYLKHLNAGDGYAVAEGCQGVTCAGYLVIENDFRGLGYASWADAIRVLVSHEFFHAVQNAYFAGVPSWVSEGQATWHEEHFYTPQTDFEGLAGYYLVDPKRSLNDRNRGPTDAFAYGAGLFFWSIDLAHDSDVIRGQLERMAAGEGAEAALDAALMERDDSLAGAFARFSVWNAFTGRRAAPGQGYPQAASLFPVNFQDFGAISAFNWNLDPAPLSAHHAVLSPGGPISVEAVALREGDVPPTLVVARPGQFSATGAYTVVKPGERAVIDHGAGELYLIALHDGAAGRRPGRIQVRAATIAPPMEPEPDMPIDAPDMADMVDMADMGLGAPDMAVVVIPPADEAAEDGCSSAQTGRPVGGWSTLVCALCALLLRRRRGGA